MNLFLLAQLVLLALTKPHCRSALFHFFYAACKDARLAASSMSRHMDMPITPAVPVPDLDDQLSLNLNQPLPATGLPWNNFERKDTNGHFVLGLRTKQSTMNSSPPIK